MREFLPREICSPISKRFCGSTTAIGRRDNIYKARIKILVHEVGVEKVTQMIEEEFAAMDRAPFAHDAEEYARIAEFFAPPPFESLPARSASLDEALASNAAFKAFVENNVSPHKIDGYAIVTVSLKPIGGIPGDASSAQMRALADASEAFSFGDMRITHAQNVVFAHVRQDDLRALWRALDAAGLATANAGLITDIISCPGLDYCALATARSIPIAQEISRRFADPDRQKLIGELGIKISGCINACGHHHVGAIGILGLEKKGLELYQITVGGDPTLAASVGELLGPGVAAEEVPGVIENLVEFYLSQKQGGERFIDTWRRLGHARFKEAWRREGEDGADI